MSGHTALFGTHSRSRGPGGRADCASLPSPLPRLLRLRVEGLWLGLWGRIPGTWCFLSTPSSGPKTLGSPFPGVKGTLGRRGEMPTDRTHSSACCLASSSVGTAAIMSAHWGCSPRADLPQAPGRSGLLCLGRKRRKDFQTSLSFGHLRAAWWRHVAPNKGRAVGCVGTLRQRQSVWGRCQEGEGGGGPGLAPGPPHFPRHGASTPYTYVGIYTQVYIYTYVLISYGHPCSALKLLSPLRR